MEIKTDHSFDEAEGKTLVRAELALYINNFFHYDHMRGASIVLHNKKLCEGSEIKDVIHEKNRRII